MRSGIGSLALFIFTLLFALAQEAAAKPDPQAALGLSRAAIGGRIPGDLRFYDTEARPLRLSELAGRPWLLVLVYTGCADICPTIIRNLHPILSNAREVIGEDRFRVVVVGFDAERDNPVRMRGFARAQGIDDPDWLFLSSDQATVDRLADAVGFTFYPAVGGYDHLAQVTLVDSEGRVYRQIYGAVFDPPQIIEPLKDLVFGRFEPVGDLGDLFDRIRLFCTVYNPNSGRYYFDYSLFIGIVIGSLCLALVAYFVVREWRRAGGPGTSRATPHR